MAVVWLFSQGRYSDYRVVGAFSSKENAQQFADAQEWDWPKIMELPLDPRVADLSAADGDGAGPDKPLLSEMADSGIVDLSVVDEQFDVSDIAGARVLYSTERDEPLSIKTFTETLADGDTLTIQVKAKGGFAI